MKKIFMFMAAAALCCISFNSCEKDDNPNGTDGTEQTDGTEGEEGNEGEGGNESEEPASPEYIADVTATATSITFTVNSTGEYGYKYAVMSKASYDSYYSMNTGEDVSDAHAQLLTIGQFMIDDVVKGSEAITVTAETLYYGILGGDDIKPSTEYYIAAVDVYPETITEDMTYDTENIKFITVTTPAE